MSPTSHGNPLPVSPAVFLAADLLLVVDSVDPGRSDIEVQGVIDVTSSGRLRRGDVVPFTWPYPLGQHVRYRRLVIPVRLQGDGSCLALSAGLPEREALRLLSGLPMDDRPVPAEQVAELAAGADAIGRYRWTVESAQSVVAHLDVAYKGRPPASFALAAPASDLPGGPWSFFDGLDRGASFGYLFLAQDASGDWTSITDEMPWNFSDRGMPPH